MHETIEIIPADADVGIVGNDILRSRIDDWISRIDRIDRETCLFRDYLPRDDERREAGADEATQVAGAADD